MEVVETCEKRSQAHAMPSTQRSFPSIDDEVVGFAKDAEYVMKKLTGGSKELDVISIFGMAGLGKTTLARKVYNNTSIINHFDVQAWCTVSQTYNMRTLLVDILEQATNKEWKIKEDFDIADKLQKTLKGRRYLIVLDDIWKVEVWEVLGLCFPKGEDGSRVIVTTRIEEVAKHLQHHSDPYSLRFLTLEESWELLQKRVFQGESCPLDLREAGLKVAKHCKGLPLVIVLIAGIIVKTEREASLWLEFANDLRSHVLGEQSMKVIQSSYEHLEDHLKPCLLYMGLFPEDHKIPVHDLLKLWMAEEFVVNVDTENMEEASRFCLNDLLKRSLVMVSRRRINGDIECCTLHDVVREFCLRKLAEEKFMQLTVPYNPYDQHLYPQESRLCIYIHDDLVNQLDHSAYMLDEIPMLESKYTKCFGECPRSLEFIAHPKFNTWNRSNPLPLLVKLRLVRVLNLMKVELPSSWATSVQSLTHLRYLEIFVEEFDFKWISHLHELQTLVVDSVQFLRTSPAAIWKMMKLRHVNINRLTSVWEDNDGAIFEESSTTMLENLKTFLSCRIRLDEKNPRFWWWFPNLEELSLRIIADVPSCPLFPIPEVHAHLQSLDLVISPKGFWNSVGWESYFVLPSNLRHLCIGGCFLTEEMVSNIARLQRLESLRLEIGFPLGNVEYCWDVRNVEFPALKYLSLLAVRMVVWNASDASFPMLEKLVLRNCYYFKEIPPSFVDIPTFRLIELFDCPDSIVVSAMDIKTEIEENTGCDSLQVLISNTPPTY
ncbi:putative late blight resistance protein homolog R1C-3 isoform X1 [Nicotiana tomentosiformis]|uniref:putative late blight resistance protein homolog R1C-3 isoform X1 n=1 Tax=Nicotiana tomentosiformis TaxID=4098 RepID=UPI00051ADCA8|nr:putative late blight resistance protein homolog R1C-3 [Nicotiana tomentosiformis]XP_033516506.1 putative late blight resistance protein homolog R1C-3 [Nicotiana tomentosiformis]XP_033516507.1 putative late blight resistance protein homolog R1C-3 [Nicotiana tomentosiformis]